MLEANATRLRGLFIVPLPPPVHGSSAVARQIRGNENINSRMQIDYLNLSTSRDMEENGCGGWKKVFRGIVIYFQVLYRILRYRYDFCYITPAVTPMGLLKDAPVMLLCRLFRKKVILHMHGKGVSGYAARHRWYRQLFRLCFTGNRVILLSQRLYRDIALLVPENRIRICPNGLPWQDTSSQCANRFNPVPRILFLSNLLESKGVFTLLDACVHLAETQIDFECNLVGNETAEINTARIEREISARKLTGKVVYRGSRYGREKEQTFIDSDVFVFPTSYCNECFPMVLLEACLWRLPIIATAEGAIEDIVMDGQNGYIVPGNDAVAVARKLEMLLADAALRTKMGEAGFHYAAERFTEKHFEKNLLAILNEVNV